MARVDMSLAVCMEEEAEVEVEVVVEADTRAELEAPGGLFSIPDGPNRSSTARLCGP
jgi:hypothetical protein